MGVALDAGRMVFGQVMEEKPEQGGKNGNGGEVETVFGIGFCDYG